MSKTAVFLCPKISAFVNICQSYGHCFYMKMAVCNNCRFTR